MSKELDCIHAVYDKFWDKDKCKVYQHVIFVPDTCKRCIRYIKKGSNDEETNID